VLVPDRPIVPGPDGNTTIPEGTKLSLPSAMRGEESLIPFFSAPSRAKTWFTGDHLVAPDRARELFGRYPDAPFVLNPGSDYGKHFTPMEVRRLLAGVFDDGPLPITIQADQKVLLGHPREIPEALIAALRHELSAIGVNGAWLMLATIPGQSEQSWMLGVDNSGSWEEVGAAIGRAVAGGALGGRMLDAKPLDSSEISATLRTGIPVIAAKRGSLH
jgi:hypothetical protein